MSDVVRIWVESACNEVLRCGGWAFVLSGGGALAGAAGGERTGSAERMALAGLVEAIRAAPTGAALEIHSATPLVLGAPARMVDADNPPFDNLDLWAPLIAAFRTPPRMFTAVKGPRSPTAFATAWSELARDKAKAGGAFRAAIPKPNLAKAGF